MEAKAVFEMIARGICPTCHSTMEKVNPDYIECHVCHSMGEPRSMRWCLKVPVFNPVNAEMFKGQLHIDEKEHYWEFMGYTEGCGREVRGGFCNSCRGFLPHPIDRAQKKSRAAPARVNDGKMNATGDM